MQPESDIIDFIIRGADLQYVEITLDPEETVVSESGTMMYMERGIQLQAKLGDGSKKNSGVFGSIMGLAKRKMTGENLFLVFFTNRTHERKKVAFAAPHPGMIIPLDLAALGGTVYCQKGAFLCGARGTSINLGIAKRIGAGLFGGEGFILQKLQGDGFAFIHAGGTVMERTLAPGESVYVDTGSIVGFQHTVSFDVTVVKGVKNMLFGGEDLFLSNLTGPGKIWVQSMPYTRFVAGIYQTLLDMQQGKKRIK